MSDRTVHGRTADGGDIVRYERAGKWYIEYAEGRPRRLVTLAGAVSAAVEEGAEHRPGLAGGGTFDARVRKALAAR